MICLVGCAPSSGSTLFADLLDSTPYSVCGPELEFFCNKNVYNYQNFIEKKQFNGSIANIRSTGTYFQKWRLPAYGFSNIEEFNNLLYRHEDIRGFTKELSEHVLRFRDKPEDGIFFEKTPQNINTVGEFLETFESSFKSLAKEGFP